MTKEAYREELAAAHARIAQLEAQLADQTATSDPKIKALEEARATVVRTSEPKYLRKFAATAIGGATFVFGIIGVVVWAAAGAHPNEAGMIAGFGGMGLFFGLLIGLLQLFLTPVTAKQQLKKIDEDLAEARRIAKLESEVAEMRRVRVASEPIAEADVQDEEAERARR